MVTRMTLTWATHRSPSMLPLRPSPPKTSTMLVAGAYVIVCPCGQSSMIRKRAHGSLITGSGELAHARIANT